MALADDVIVIVKECIDSDSNYKGVDKDTIVASMKLDDIGACHHRMSYMCTSLGLGSPPWELEEGSLMNAWATGTIQDVIDSVSTWVVNE